ncbi:MAG: hypothetical protein KDD56_06405, partial [Bdellovibrionales bacterium]|nr:hypothetical protein [Bdellovibrionales bacterium]
SGLYISPSPQNRFAGYGGIKISENDAFSAILEGLQSEDPFTRESSIDLTCSLKIEQNIDKVIPIVADLINDPDKGVSLAAITAIASFGKKASIAEENLRIALNKNDNHFSHIAFALYKIGADPKEGIDKIKILLNIDDKFINQKRTALHLLADFGKMAMQVADELKSILRYGEDKSKTNDRTSIIPCIENETLLRLGVLHIVSHIKADAAPLLDALFDSIKKEPTSDGYPSYLDSLAESISNIGASAVPFLINKLKNPAKDVAEQEKFVALKSLALIGPDAKEAAPELFKILLETKRRESRYPLVRALVSMEESIHSFLEEKLKSSDIKASCLAMELFAQIVKEPNAADIALLNEKLTQGLQTNNKNLLTEAAFSIKTYVQNLLGQTKPTQSLDTQCKLTEALGISAKNLLAARRVVGEKLDEIVKFVIPFTSKDAVKP